MLTNSSGEVISWEHPSNESNPTPPVALSPGADTGGTQVRSVLPFESQLDKEGFRFQHGHEVVIVTFHKVDCPE